MAIPDRTATAWKAAGDAQRFGWDLTKELAQLSDTIASVTYATTGGVTVTGTAQTATAFVFRVSGGTAGTPATVVSTITTAGGDTLTAKVELTISS